MIPLIWNSQTGKINLMIAVRSVVASEWGAYWERREEIFTMVEYSLLVYCSGVVIVVYTL